MKKVLLAPLFIVAATVSTAWAQTEGEHCRENGQLLFCQWDTGCFTVNNQYNPNIGIPCETLVAGCVKDGQLFAGSSVPPDLNKPDLWGEGEDCRQVGLTFLRGKEDCGGYCLWEGTNCVKIAPDPDGDYGDVTANCAEAIANCAANGQPSNSATCSDVGGSPIITTLSGPALANSMSAMQSSVSLQVTGAATVRIFDMKGTAIRVQRVEKGSYVVQLSSLPRGLYIVQAASGSWKQTAKVAVK